MKLNIELEAFEGPFDLLLKLIDKQKIDIYDVKIEDITSPFLEEVAKMNIDLPSLSLFTSLFSLRFLSWWLIADWLISSLSAISPTLTGPSKSSYMIRILVESEKILNKSARSLRVLSEIFFKSTILAPFISIDIHMINLSYEYYNIYDSDVNRIFIKSDSFYRD